MNVDFVFDVVNDDNKSSNVNTERQIMDEEMTIITFIRLR